MLLSISHSLFARRHKKIDHKNTIEVTMETISQSVKKYALDNGMTVLVLESHQIPIVSIQIWYNVGSKDEQTGEKGIAHLIEHMIFKGTAGESSLNLAESDINLIVRTLSGSCNAFTTQDFTGYKFDLPTQNWQQILPIIADCMTNCAFKDDHLNSEMKAVIQELKMRKDNYLSSLAESMITAMFPDHPYHYPIIGFKQDLWNVNGQDLKQFYQKHYAPNNATLVVVGDVKADEVAQLAEQYFGHIPTDTSYTRPEFYLNKDISSKSVTIYRDVAQPTVLLGYTVPGLTNPSSHIIELLSWVIGLGKGSRLYKILVDEQKLVTSLSAYHWDILFDHSVFFILFEPKNIDATQEIIDIIQDELDDLTKNGVTDQELKRAINQTKMRLYSTLESTDDQAFDIGKFFLATGNENYIFNYMNDAPETIKKEMHSILKQYFRPSVTHKGMVLPIPEEEKSYWVELQQASDAQDKEILFARERTSPLEDPSYALSVHSNKTKQFSYPKANTYTTDNGITIFTYHNPKTPKINISLKFKAQGHYDPVEQQGLYNFVAQMMSEGTKNFSATALAQELETRGMSLSVSPGSISLSMLNSELERGLELLLEILTNATFNETEIEKIRDQIQSEIKNFWDNPSSFAGQLIREHVYQGHPYSKNLTGKAEIIETISQQDLINCYRSFIVPDQTRIAIVGDLAGYDVQKLIQEKLKSWTGKAVETIQCPVLQTPESKQINYPINRDQVLLCFAGLSINRTHPDYDKLIIFDQILGGGALGSMSSRLFKLREQSGLFYSINGSLTAATDKEPGMVLVQTLVSLDRLQEAEQAIIETLKHVADQITPQEFEEAKQALITASVQYFESNSKIASAFLFLDKYNFPADYFDTRAARLEKISIADVQKAVRNILKTDLLSVFKIGRV